MFQLTTSHSVIMKFLKRHLFICSCYTYILKGIAAIGYLNASAKPASLLREVSKAWRSSFINVIMLLVFLLIFFQTNKYGPFVNWASLTNRPSANSTNFYFFYYISHYALIQLFSCCYVLRRSFSIGIDVISSELSF